MDSDEDIPHEKQAPGAPKIKPSRVPLTIITGFLGSGKSTFLKYVLTERHGYRIAIIMNEFGDTADIEGRAISVSSPDAPESLATEFLELANGCLCCSVKDSGAAAIEQLMRKQGAFDYIMLETTGLADPGPIAAMFWQNEDFSDQILLDGVICVVDAVFGLKGLESEDSAASRQQIALADVLLVNKMDLIPTEENTIATLEQRLRTLNTTAPLIQTTHGRVDLSQVLNIGAYHSFKPSDTSTSHTPHDHDHDHDHTAACHQHDLQSISSVQLSVPTLSNAQLVKLDEWIRSVLWEKKFPGDVDETPGLEVLRCKGIYHTTAGKRYILQGVQILYDITEVPERDSDGATGGGKVVFIGRGLNEATMLNLKQYIEI
ncbi:cobW-domain-containing protein [Ceratobasidium sp. AG-I]|nr:cobW-domain-containing protein [Ceratobasidium sp. AG-I]